MTFLAIALLASTLNAAPLAVDRAHREIRINATVQPDAMDRMFGVNGHHAIVWREGKSQRNALFVSDASDHEVRVALNSLGARAGENLTADSWNKRDDATSAEPDKRVEGSLVDVFVEWRGSKGRIPLAELIAEKGRAKPQLDFRYGGNERYQKEFKSGCIVCLYSCPGGAIGNHAHPIRDSVRDGVVYSSLANRLPPAGSRVTIILKLR
ncbi:MAG TPA: YdjY domain-containing protein [Thermoanaerobaculia bacterium]|nr:YdjY domain-containing protein [Thermoanaerobaculia bacterium]